MGYHLLTEDTMAGSSPTVRRRQLGMELRRLRELVGKTQEDAGDWLGIDSTAVSRMESGKRRVTVSHLRSYFQLYEVGSPHADYLLTLCREGAQRGWFVSYGKTVPRWFRDYIGMETAAAEVWTWEPLFVPGLLQARAYTEALGAALNPTRTAEEIQRLAQLRADRQQRLTDDDPLALRALIDEAALRREVGGPEVMHAQLAHLAKISTLPNVTVQVTPFSAGAHRGMRGAFTALRFPQEPMNTVYLELYGEALYIEAPSEVARYAEIFEELAQTALSGDDTAELIANMIEGRDR
ncbi:MAG: helix-turn-helix domain-containing protein [Pseudonocardiaceae bacterium]